MRNGTITHFVSIQRDITARKRLEEQLVQSQKLESVGKLAGGVAHEFNNIMTLVIGHSELLLNDLPAEHPLHRSAQAIRKAADRVATLTRQLLAYGRRQLLRPERLDLNQTLGHMEGMFRHLLGSDVEILIRPAADLHIVHADAGQVEQVIMNMVLNAHDAMPDGGKLTLETGNVTFDEENTDPYSEFKPGSYAMLAITDTGRGMSPEVKARVFEPFFSTKDVGKGTGLGLATCYGIIKQSGGHISVVSEPGQGTTFKIYLPQAPSQTQSPAAGRRAARPARRDGNHPVGRRRCQAAGSGGHIFWVSWATVCSRRETGLMPWTCWSNGAKARFICCVPTW